MLPERFRQLLTAYVDGEVSKRQHKAVLRLLRRAPEARTVLRQLQEDAKLLRTLPRLHLDRDLSVPVAQAIRERNLRPVMPRAALHPERFPLLPDWAAGALLLVAIGR